MKKPAGRSIPLSLPRRWVTDLSASGKAYPTVAVEKSLRVKALVDARAALSDPPSWCSMVTKAFGIASSRLPELRRSYLSFPYQRLYEHPASVSAIVLSRDFEGEPAVFFGLIQAPESLPLREVESRLRQLKSGPVHEIGSYRRLIRIARLPRPLRRLLWWFGLHVAGRQKSANFGTFSVSSVRSMGIRMIQFLSPVTSTLYYDSPGSDGTLSVQMAFDHRVFDGEAAGRALGELESILNTEMISEIAQLAGQAPG